MKNYILFVLLICFISVQAQEPDLSDKAITWNCSSVTDNVNNNTVSLASKVISEPKAIKWDQNGSEQVFTVISRSWKWQSGEGTITYQIEYGDGTGTVKIKGDTIQINLTTSAGKASFSLQVTNYTY